jgi:hypothetical protein
MKISDEQLEKEFLERHNINIPTLRKKEEEILKFSMGLLEKTANEDDDISEDEPEIILQKVKELYTADELLYLHCSFLAKKLSFQLERIATMLSSKE